eukprot:g10002.t1
MRVLFPFVLQGATLGVRGVLIENLTKKMHSRRRAPAQAGVQVHLLAHGDKRKAATAASRAQSAPGDATHSTEPSAHAHLSGASVVAATTAEAPTTSGMLLKDDGIRDEAENEETEAAASEIPTNLRFALLLGLALLSLPATTMIVMQLCSPSSCNGLVSCGFVRFPSDRRLLETHEYAEYLEVLQGDWDLHLCGGRSSRSGCGRVMKHAPYTEVRVEQSRATWTGSSAGVEDGERGGKLDETRQGRDHDGDCPAEKVERDESANDAEQMRDNQRVVGKTKKLVFSVCPETFPGRLFIDEHGAWCEEADIQELVDERTNEIEFGDMSPPGPCRAPARYFWTRAI